MTQSEFIAELDRRGIKHKPVWGRKDRLLVLCPFHKEKTPSMSVTPGTGRFYCFGCRTKGDSLAEFAALLDEQESDAGTA